MNPLSSCTLCPRLCRADRAGGKTGFCRVGSTVLVTRAAPHRWEEPCLCGEGGSGTVFFGGCNLGCLFCQNRAISRGEAGIPVTEEQLAAIFLSLAEQGVSNLNLVTPTPWVPHIKAALEMAWDKGFWLPVVYNCGGYENASVIASLRGYVGVYLPDFKYFDPALGQALSGVPDYPARMMEALREMVAQRGEPRFDGDGLMTRGVIVRHLVLPGHTDDSKRILGYLHREYGDSIYISIMNQYTPMPGMEGELARPLTEEEYAEVTDYARAIGIRQAFLQEGGTVSESFIPAFDGEGVLPC
ncbi:MAG: radical SAM protein [Ruminococcaceae bacterium]|nr:radical SAM protein [Oscillospiraceae bacterium]